MVTALVLLFGRTVAEAEERVRGELLDRPARPAATSTRTRLRERARRQRRGPRRVRRAVAVARVDGDRAAPRRPARRRAGGGAAAASPARTRAPSSLVAPEADPLDLGRALRTRLATVGARVTVGVAAAGAGARDVAGGVPRGPPLRRHAARPRPGRRGQRPRRPRRRPAAARRTTGPPSSRTSSRRSLGPLLDYDERARHRPGRRPWRRGSTPAARLAETAERAARAPQHRRPAARPGRRAARRRTGATPDRGLDLQLALRLHRLRSVLT